MINIEYYPPFMVDIRNKYTCKPMCDYLCEQWKSIINEKQRIIDLTKEYIKNKQKSNTNTYTDQIGTNKYVDIGDFVNKYNRFVQIYNDCVDNLNDTIYHIMRSPDDYAEYYTREELEKLHIDLTKMIKKDQLLKRHKLILDKTVYELSQNLLDILSSTDELIYEIIIEILDIVEISKYFKFDPFEKIIQELIDTKQIGGTLSFTDVKNKINLITEKLQMLSNTIYDSQFLKNHTQFSSIAESIEMLDKLNLQISKKKFKKFEFDVDNLKFPTDTLTSFNKKNDQKFSINLNYTDFDEKKLRLLEQKLALLKQTNKKIQQKINNPHQNKFGVEVSYVPTDIKYDTNETLNELKTEHTRLTLFLSDLTSKLTNLKLIVHELRDPNNILHKIVVTYEVLNKDYFENKNIINLTNILTTTTDEEKDLVINDLTREYENLLEIIKENNRILFLKLDKHKSRFTKGAESHIDAMYSEIKNILLNMENKNITITNIKSKIKELADNSDKRIYNKLNHATSKDPNYIYNFLSNYGIESILREHYEELPTTYDLDKLDRQTSRKINDHYRNFYSKYSGIAELYGIIDSQIKQHVNITTILDTIKSWLKNFGFEDSEIFLFLNDGIINIVNNNFDKLESTVSSANKIKDKLKNFTAELKNFNDLFDQLKSKVYYQHLLENYSEVDLVGNNLESVINTSISDITLDMQTKKVRIEELEKILDRHAEVNIDYFQNKIIVFEKKIKKIYDHIFAKIQTLNNFLPDDEQLTIINTMVDNWYIESVQIGGTLTSDKNIIISKIQQFSATQLVILNKVKELSEEMRLFRLNIVDYLKVTVQNVKQELQMLYGLSYIITIFKEITTQKYKFLKSIDYELFEKMKLSVTTNKNFVLRQVILRTINLCNFLENDFKTKQTYSIMIDETNKLFIDLIIFSHLATNY